MHDYGGMNGSSPIKAKQMLKVSHIRELWLGLDFGKRYIEKLCQRQKLKTMCHIAHQHSFGRNDVPHSKFEENKLTFSSPAGQNCI